MYFVFVKNFFSGSANLGGALRSFRKNSGSNALLQNNNRMHFTTFVLSFATVHPFFAR